MRGAIGGARRRGTSRRDPDADVPDGDRAVVEHRW
jgi:hypothetical protein